MYRWYYVLIFIILTAGIPLVSFGQSAITADCGLVNSRTAIVFGESNTELLPEEAIQRVTKNLRAYCCEQKYLRNTDEVTVCDQDMDIPTNSYFPQSAYLFDHLVDMMLRRLDGNEALIYPDVPVHPQGKERRELMREYASNPDGVMPAAVVNSTTEYWDSEKGEAALYVLYNSVCDTANKYYRSLFTLSAGSAGARELTRALELCQELVGSRIQYELMYARMIINLQANRMLSKSMTTHLVDYYSNNRLMTLQSSIAEMVGAFTTVNRFVVEGTRQCSM